MADGRQLRSLLGSRVDDAEADLRGLAVELADFDDEPSALRDALWYCHITTSPDGEPVAATERIAEIKRRYGPGHLVTRFITLATPNLLAAVSRTEVRMRASAAKEGSE